MVVLQPLALASTLQELQQRGKIGDVSRMKAKQLCESGEKVLREAIVKRDTGDEEGAYILFFKYVELVNKIRSHPEFKKDEKYYVSMFNIQKNLRKAVEALEALTTSLEERYSDLKRQTLKEISEEVTNAKSKSKKDKIDFNCNEHLTSTPTMNGLKKSHKKEPELETKDYLITYKSLHSIITDKATSFFLLDTRTSDDYKASHMNIPQSLNVPEQVLRPGTTASTIGKSLGIQERFQWDSRASKDLLIICDWTSSDFMPGSPATVLRDALTKWDVEAKHKAPPYLLEGGYEKYLLAYPHSVTNPKVRAPPMPSSATIRQVTPKLSVDYPDLDNGFLVTPSPSPKSIAAVNSGALKITKEPATVAPPQQPSTAYPSLSAELNNLTPKVSRSNTPSSTNLTTIFAPSIPDRSCKPDMSRDELNDARTSFSSVISRTDSASSVVSDNSKLNNALIAETSLPTVDRGSKRQAMFTYYGVDESTLDNVENVLKAEIDVVEKSYEREKEKLDLENKWDYLRLKKEAELEAEMRQEIMEEQEKLVKHLDKLSLENKEKEDSERKLLAELEALKKQLKEKDDRFKDYQRNEEERRRKDRELEQRRQDKKKLLENIEMKRKERKKREQQQQQQHQQQQQQQQRPSHEQSPLRDRGQGGLSRATLKTADDDQPSGGGRLKRSFSSPNIAKMLEQETSDMRHSGVPVPKFDRTQKPSLITSRNFAGVWGTQKPGLTGLKNLGNTCYMNSILQCVSNTPPLAHYFVSRSYEEDLNDKYSKTRGHVASEFAEVLKHLWSSQYKSISPSDLKSRVGRYKSTFAGRDQQDSHEFLCAMLEWLHDDVNRVAKPSDMPEQNIKDKRDIKAAKRHWINYLERNQSIVVQLFCGQTRSVVKCFLCNGESVTYSHFTMLTLPLPEHSSRASVRECLELYLREEIVNDYKCEICKRSGKVTKKIDIVKLPPLLIIHLSRFYHEGMYTRKKQNFVHFDLKNVNIGQYAVSGFDNRHDRFNLYAVSNHFGSLEGGHYTAYCSSDVHKKWYKFDDQDVSVMDPSDVVTPAAYILFYSALEGQTSLPPLG